MAGTNPVDDQSAWTGAEVKCYLRYDAIDLMEIQSVEYSVDRKGRPGGAGLGHPQNRYHKFGVPQGTFSISKNYLNSGDQSELLADLIGGVSTIETVTLAPSATTATITDATGIVGVVVDGNVLTEGNGYTVNYATATLTLTAAVVTAGKVFYTKTAANVADAMNGDNHPFIFDVEWRSKDTTATTAITRLVGCAPYQHSVKSGGTGEEAFTEDLSGEFLRLEVDSTIDVGT